MPKYDYQRATLYLMKILENYNIYNIRTKFWEIQRYEIHEASRLTNVKACDPHTSRNNFPWDLPLYGTSARESNIHYFFFLNIASFTQEYTNIDIY